MSFFCVINASDSRKKLPQDFGKENLTLSLTKSASNGYFSAFFAFISRHVMQFKKKLT